MKNIRSYILLFLLFFVGIFSNDWANAVSKNIPNTQDNIVVQTIDLGEDTDISILVSSRSYQVIKKIFHSDSYFYNLTVPLKLGQKIFVSIAQVHVRCAIKSFLHLLQLF